MGKIQHGAELPVRNMPKVNTTDVDAETVQRAQLVSLARIEHQLKGLSLQLSDETRPVDEYSVVGGYSPSNETFVEVQPQFDTMGEKITSILITGPANTLFTLQLGDRNLSLTTNSNGIVVMAPIAMLLGRNDRRLLTSVTAGNWTLELMGNADSRY